MPETIWPKRVLSKYFKDNPSEEEHEIDAVELLIDKACAERILQRYELFKTTQAADPSVWQLVFWDSHPARWVGGYMSEDDDGEVYVDEIAERYLPDPGPTNDFNFVDYVVVSPEVPVPEFPESCDQPTEFGKVFINATDVWWQATPDNLSLRLVSADIPISLIAEWLGVPDPTIKPEVELPAPLPAPGTIAP